MVVQDKSQIRITILKVEENAATGNPNLLLSEICEYFDPLKENELKEFQNKEII